MTSAGDAAVDTIVSTVGLWWPDAEVDELRAAAQAWERAASALDDVAVRVGPEIERVVAHGQGSTSVAIGQRWATMERDGFAPTVEGCRAMALALRGYADEVEAAQREIELLAVELGAGIVVGVALAYVTFGASAAVAGGIAARLVALAASIGVRVSNTVAAIASTTLVGAGFGTADAVAANTVAQAYRVGVHGDGGFSPTELATSAAWGGAGGAVPGGLAGAWATRALRHPAPGADLLRARGGAIRAALDPTDWGPLHRAWTPGLVEGATPVLPKERVAVQAYVDEGAMVHARPVRDVDGVKNPDFLVRRSSTDHGVYVEVKELKEPTSAAVKRNIRAAQKQLDELGGGEVFIDGRPSGLTGDVLERGWKRTLGELAHSGREPPTVRVQLNTGVVRLP